MYLIFYYRPIFAAYYYCAVCLWLVVFSLNGFAASYLNYILMFVLMFWMAIYVSIDMFCLIRCTFSSVYFCLYSASKINIFLLFIYTFVKFIPLVSWIFLLWIFCFVWVFFFVSLCSCLLVSYLFCSCLFCSRLFCSCMFCSCLFCWSFFLLYYTVDLFNVLYFLFNNCTIFHVFCFILFAIL